MAWPYEVIRDLNYHVSAGLNHIKDLVVECNSLYPGLFVIFLSSADFFFQNELFQKIFQEYHQSVKYFRSKRQPDQGPNCLQNGKTLSSFLS